MRYTKGIISIFLALHSFCAMAQLDKVEVKLKDNSADLCPKSAIEHSASRLLSTFNETIISGKAKVKLSQEDKIIITKEGLDILQELWNTSAMICPVSRVVENCIQLPSGEYQIRNIPITLMAADEENEEQELVLNFNAAGTIDNIMIALDEHRYMDIINQNISVSDFHCRQTIIDFIENFRTAYNRKDLDYIEKIYSDNALIITGKVIKEKPSDSSTMYKGLSSQKIAYQKQTKGEYISRLRSCFKRNKFINVRFEELEVMRHPKKDHIYGATLKQYWDSENYSDVGYLFLMIDFEDEKNPSIQVRTWQPDKYLDGTPISRDEVFTVNDFSI